LLGDGNDSDAQSLGGVSTDGSSGPEPVFPSQDYIHLTDGAIQDCCRRHRKVRPEDGFRAGHYVGFRTRPSDLPGGRTDIKFLSTAQIEQMRRAIGGWPAAGSDSFGSATWSLVELLVGMFAVVL